MEKYTIRGNQDDSDKLYKRLMHMSACLAKVYGEIDEDQSHMMRLVFKSGVVFEPEFHKYAVRTDMVWRRKYPLHVN